MDAVITIIKIILGLTMVIFPINALFIKAFKPKMVEKAQLVMDTFRDTGYFLNFIQGTELIIGILLLTGLLHPISVDRSYADFNKHFTVSPILISPGFRA